MAPHPATPQGFAAGNRQPCNLLHNLPPGRRGRRRRAPLTCWSRGSPRRLAAADYFCTAPPWSRRTYDGDHRGAPAGVSARSGRVHRSSPFQACASKLCHDVAGAVLTDLAVSPVPTSRTCAVPFRLPSAPGPSTRWGCTTGRTPRRSTRRGGGPARRGGRVPGADGQRAARRGADRGGAGRRGGPGRGRPLRGVGAAAHGRRGRAYMSIFLSFYVAM